MVKRFLIFSRGIIPQQWHGHCPFIASILFYKIIFDKDFHEILIFGHKHAIHCDDTRSDQTVE